jgi:hypothetical protein
MPESRKNLSKLIYWHEAKEFRKRFKKEAGPQPSPDAVSRYLTPIEEAQAREEGWSRITSEMCRTKR